MIVLGHDVNITVSKRKYTTINYKIQKTFCMVTARVHCFTCSNSEKVNIGCFKFIAPVLQIRLITVNTELSTSVQLCTF